MNTNKMQIEIWSDIMCPFCYMGKRKFEIALADFKDKDNVEITWRSFQLNPDLKTNPDISVNDYLAKAKGWTVDYAKQMNENVSNAAKAVGLEYNMDKAVVANTLKAHYFLHFAKEYNKQNKAKELLLKAYFTEGKNIDDIPTLAGIGRELGLNEEKLAGVLKSDEYFEHVRQDIYNAQQLGIRGVPFFVFDNKYGVSGAQEPAVFLETLNKSFTEWRESNPLTHLNIIEGTSCSTDGKL